jgi:drug/metabolite transporter (DMT)-like permease
MNIITKLPGPLLIFLGALSLSFGGLIVKSFEGATLWQILFWRSLFFTLTILAFLVISYKKKTFKAFYDSGLPGFIGGIILSFGFCGYVFAMYNTTVANTNFIISLQILFLAIFGYFFLKEKISLITLASIVLAMTGVLVMVGNSLTPGELSGNLAAFTMPITFSVLIMIVRKFPTVDMVPAQFVAGVCSCLIGFLLSTKIMISPNDIFLGFLAGFFQVGFGFIFITIGARTTPSAMVGIIMLSVSVLGPIWAFLFVSERPSIFGLVGGAIILFAVLLQFYSLLTKSKKSVSN